MRVTSKGQVTIPQAIREQLGIQPGTEVSFEVDGDAIRIVKTADSPRGRAIVDRLRGTGHGRMSTDEIMALTRGE
ncbi:MAG TPA: AbrB/MazE/SpoVT family DNA-binding domain-containing protein [Capillimicrobium sp.]|nr:AbrB/MazE/SpoVT family DNA-binding domain-containing protein [Capillimicrobium sp.]